MPFNILLLPLIGGFVFISTWNRTKFKAIRLDKERLLFYASLAGLGLLSFAYVLHSLIPPFIPCISWLPCLPLLPFEYISVSFTALILGLLLPYPLNLYWKEDEESSRYIEDEGDPFEQLINKALDTAKPVMLTLSNSKVYVGFVISSFSPAREQRTIHIAPIKSGYREGTKQRVNFTTDYSIALDKITSDLAKLSVIKEEAEVELERLKESYKTQEQTRAGLAEEGEKKKVELQKTTDAMTLSSTQQEHLESVIRSQTEAIESLSASIDDFGFVIPIDEITSATLYSAQIHAEYFPHQDPE